MGISMKNLTRRRVAPRSLFSTIAEDVLPGWEISLVFVGPAKAKALNKQMRKKSYVPNVLSYALGNKSAEIIICPSEAEKQAAGYEMNKKTFILYLFIHGVLHVKGWAHGARMEKCEDDLLARFNETPNRYRNRHRHVPSKDGRRRRAGR